MRCRLAAALLLAAVARGVAPVAAVEIPDGYRLDHYRAPTPDRVPGAVTLDTAGIAALLERERPVLIDTTPALRTGETDFSGEWLVAQERRDLPGSLWLPNIGYGSLDATMERYFRQNLEQATGGDRERAVVFYCYLDCWMSWNAAKRAAAWGWRRVYWYPEGTDGWAAAGRPLTRAEPVPLIVE
ncbi:PQQ-dependent catabolism-associated CXXCW motif protein [Benzoatithermus flavus]|uniref:PQQ-dependent catabolism-associated CXXCW motif protein n=1 Tax=Benzoatithermus flavus TaxID=3108223 RepID=A0ABU8XVT3_9PROT